MRFWEALQKMMSEVSRENLKKIEKRAAKFAAKNYKKQPFNDIFGDKSRIVIPLQTEEENQFLDFLHQNGLSDIDIRTGTGSRETKTNQGIKKQTVKIGKFLQILSKEDSEAKYWLTWWEQNKVKLNQDRDVSIVVSRNPIDILRMSDHKGIKSCHSQGGTWFRCAVEEAKTGGAVAMVVKNNDLDKVDLSADEIFSDPQRKIDGIVPLERLRLRRFQDDNNNYLVPELSTYGTRHSGTLETVTRWVRQEQSEKLKNVDWDKIKLRGGGYQDNNADELWNNFVGENKFSGEKESEDQSTEDKDYEARAQELIQAKQLKHFSVDSEAQNIDGQQMLINTFTVGFEFDKSEISNWPKEDDWIRIRKIRELIKKEIDVYVLDDINFNHYKESYIVGLSFHGEEDSGTLQSLERLLDDIKDYDDSYERHKDQVRYALIQSDVLKNPIDKIELSYLKEVEPRNTYGKYNINSSTSRGNAKYSFRATAIIGNLAGLPKTSISFEPNGFILTRRNRNQLYPQSVADFYLTDKVRNALDAKLNKEEKEEIKDRQVGFRAEFIVEGDAGHIIQNIEDSPADDFTEGNVLLVLDVDSTSINPHDISVVEKLDKYFPFIVEEAKKDWQLFKQTASEKVNYGGVTTNASAYTLAQSIARDIEDSTLAGGEVFIKNVGGKDIFWYENKEKGISMPPQQLVKMMRDFTHERDKLLSQMRYNNRRQGNVETKFMNGQPVAIWIDSDGKTMPLKQAVDFYQAEEK